jgi:hypothetical protein
MTSKMILIKLIELKASQQILDYLIETDFTVKNDKTYVKTRLTIFPPSGKPQITTGLVQGEAQFSDIECQQAETIVIAWNQNPII